MRRGTFVVLALGAAALDNGLGLVPQMGYNTWYDVECTGAMNETVLTATAAAQVKLGLLKAGYDYFNLDDCWAKGRYANGSVYADTAKFPSGSLKPLADYVHDKGMKFGTYSDRGSNTCAGRPGALDHEEIDAATYAAWGVDYLKEDSCHASTDHDTAFQQYGRMRDALNKTGRPIFFSLCGWNTWYAPEGMKLGNSWRTGPDNTNWKNILTNIDNMDGLEKYAGPGGFNDPCLLLSTDGQGRQMVTDLQTRAQFSMWAVLASPLIISGSLLNISQQTLATYTNAQVIAVNQDPLAKQGSRLVGGDMIRGDVNVWARPLTGNRSAVVFINSNLQLRDATCGWDCFSAMGFKSENVTLIAQDLWGGSSYRIPNRTLTETAMPKEGGHAMFVVRELMQGEDASSYPVRN